jgi:hypothetical protein
MIQEIEIGGSLRPVKFGFNSLALFGELTGYKVAQMQSLGSELTMKDVITLMWCGLKEGARKQGKEFNASIEDVGDWIDEAPEAISGMMNIYSSSQAPPVKKKANPVRR